MQAIERIDRYTTDMDEVGFLSSELGACRACVAESENRPQRGQFLPDLQAHSPAMGQKDGKKWTAAVGLQPAIRKSDRLLVQDAVVRNIEIVGEASNSILRVDAAFAAAHDEIPWQVMHTMRNLVSHGTEQVDLEIVWKTIRGDLPTLHAQVHEALVDLHRDDDNQAVTP